MHYYPGLRMADIMGMTVHQYKARLQDVDEIERAKAGKGKGRITRDPIECLQRKAEARGLVPPTRRATG